MILVNWHVGLLEGCRFIVSNYLYTVGLLEEIRYSLVRWDFCCFDSFDMCRSSHGRKRMIQGNFLSWWIMSDFNCKGNGRRWARNIISFLRFHPSFPYYILFSLTWNYLVTFYVEANCFANKLVSKQVLATCTSFSLLHDETVKY